MPSCVNAVELIDVDPRWSPLRIPRPGPDAEEIAIAVVGLAGEPHREDPVGILATHDQDGAVLAAPVVLGVGHPRPDDLTRVGIAVDVGRVADPQPIAHAAGRSRPSPITGAADRIGTRRRAAGRRCAGRG